MSTTTVDRLVAEYLERLQAAAATLPPEQRYELVDEIGGHITSARAAGAAADEAAVRTLLDRLGPPEEIVAAAREDDAAPAPLPARPPGTGLELSAVLLLTVGSFLLVIGWLVGFVLLWVSRRWTTREKLLGTLVIPLGPGGLLLLGAAGVLPFAGQCSGPATMVGPDGVTAVIEGGCRGGLPTWLGLPLLLAAALAPVVVAVVLYRRAQSRAATEPGVLVVPGGSSPWTGHEIAAVLLLGLGAFLAPLVGPLIGLVLVWSSQRWTRAQKAIGTALALVPALLLLLLPLGSLLIARTTL